MPVQGHSVLVSVCRWRHCTLLIIFTDQAKAQFVLWSYSPREILGFFI